MGDHNERYRQLALNISHFRKKKGLSQQQLAELAHISRGHLSHIEAPNMLSSVSLLTLFEIAQILEIEPYELFKFK